jgi:hypothetical protein
MAEQNDLRQRTQAARLLLAKLTGDSTDCMMIALEVGDDASNWPCPSHARAAATSTRR